MGQYQSYGEVKNTFTTRVFIQLSPVGNVSIIINPLYYSVLAAILLKQFMHKGKCCLFWLFTCRQYSYSIIYLFRVLRRFQHSTGHITKGSWKGRGNQYIEFVRVLYCKLLTNGKHLPAFPLEAVPGIEPRPQRWEAQVLPLCHDVKP